MRKYYVEIRTKHLDGERESMLRRVWFRSALLAFFYSLLPAWPYREGVRVVKTTNATTGVDWPTVKLTIEIALGVAVLLFAAMLVWLASVCVRGAALL